MYVLCFYLFFKFSYNIPISDDSSKEFKYINEISLTKSIVNSVSGNSLYKIIKQHTNGNVEVIKIKIKIQVPFILSSM